MTPETLAGSDRLDFETFGTRCDRVAALVGKVLGVEPGFPVGSSSPATVDYGLFEEEQVSCSVPLGQRRLVAALRRPKGGHGATDEMRELWSGEKVLSSDPGGANVRLTKRPPPVKGREPKPVEDVGKAATWLPGDDVTDVREARLLVLVDAEHGLVLSAEEPPDQEPIISTPETMRRVALSLVGSLDLE